MQPFVFVFVFALGKEQAELKAPNILPLQR